MLNLRKPKYRPEAIPTYKPIISKNAIAPPIRNSPVKFYFLWLFVILPDRLKLSAIVLDRQVFFLSVVQRKQSYIYTRIRGFLDGIAFQNIRDR